MPASRPAYRAGGAPCGDPSAPHPPLHPCPMQTRPTCTCRRCPPAPTRCCCTWRCRWVVGSALGSVQVPACQWQRLLAAWLDELPPTACHLPHPRLCPQRLQPRVDVALDHSYLHRYYQSPPPQPPHAAANGTADGAAALPSWHALQAGAWALPGWAHYRSRGLEMGAMGAGGRAGALVGHGHG